MLGTRLIREVDLFPDFRIYFQNVWAKGSLAGMIYFMMWRLYYLEMKNGERNPYYSPREGKRYARLLEGNAIESIERSRENAKSAKKVPRASREKAARFVRHGKLSTAKVSKRVEKNKRSVSNNGRDVVQRIARGAAKRVLAGVVSRSKRPGRAKSNRKVR